MLTIEENKRGGGINFNKFRQNSRTDHEKKGRLGVERSLESNAWVARILRSKRFLTFFKLLHLIQLVMQPTKCSNEGVLETMETNTFWVDL